MRPSADELEELRSDALEDEAFRKAMRASAACAQRWELDHRISPTTLARAISRLMRLFPRLRRDPTPTRGNRFPLL